MDPRRRRSHGLRYVNRATGWLAGAGVVASGAFIALLARPHPTTATTRTTTGTVNGGATTTTFDPFAGGDGAPGLGQDDGGGGNGGASVQPLSPPVQAPVAAPGGGQVSTGAS